MRALLLDCMGTLLHLDAPVPRLRAGLADRLGVRVSEAEAGRALRAEVAHYRAHHDEARDADSLAALRRDCARVLAAELPGGEGLDVEVVTATLLEALRFAPFPDAAPALRAARERGVRVAVVSNWDVSLHDALAAAGLADLVDAAVSSAEAGAAKPDPAIFRRALDLLDAAPTEAVHAGDSLEHDVAGARAAGVQAVLVDRAGDGGPADVRRVRSLAELTAP